jgi:hypothetical protein
MAFSLEIVYVIMFYPFIDDYNIYGNTVSLHLSPRNDKNKCTIKSLFVYIYLIFLHMILYVCYETVLV